VLTKKPNSMSLINFPHPHDFMEEKGFDAQDRAATNRRSKIHYSSVPSFQQPNWGKAPKF